MKNTSPFFVLVFCLILPLRAVAMFQEGEEAGSSKSRERPRDSHDATRTSTQLRQEAAAQTAASKFTDQQIYDDSSGTVQQEELSSHYESMEPTAAAQRSPIDPERFSTPIRKERDIPILPIAETTPTKLPFLTELQERASRKESSQDSISTRALSLEGKTQVFLPTRRVTFPDLPPLSEERVAIAEKPTIALRESLSAKQISNKQLDQSIRRLKSLTTGLEIAVDEIAEEDPQRASKIAAIYKQAYPRFQAHLEFLLRAIDEGSILKNQRSLLHLGRSAIQLLEVAFQSIDRSSMEPVEIEPPLESLDPQDPFVTRNLPYRLVSIGAKKIEPRSRQLEEMIRIADNTIYSLQKFIEALKASDENIGRLFLESRVERISRKMNIIARRICNFNNILDATYLEDHEALEEVNQSHQEWLESNNVLERNQQHATRAIATRTHALLQQITPLPTEQGVRTTLVQQLIRHARVANPTLGAHISDIATWRNDAIATLERADQFLRRHTITNVTPGAVPAPATIPAPAAAVAGGGATIAPLEEEAEGRLSDSDNSVGSGNTIGSGNSLDVEHDGIEQTPPATPSPVSIIDTPPDPSPPTIIENLPPLPNNNNT